MRYSIACALLAILIGARCGLAAENNSNEASGFAEGGAALLATSKTDKAQTLFYKALVYDSHCAVALYELGKLFDAEGNAVSAADFLARASLELAKGEAAHPNYAVKYQDATQRLQKLNPYALQYNQIMEDYARNLCQLTKKSPDSLTAEEVCTRIDTLNLAMLLPKDKLPNVCRPVLELGGGVKLELVFVKAGEFDMGVKPAHKVKISKPYYIGKYDVTVAQFRAFADAVKFQTEAEKGGSGLAVKDGNWQSVHGVNWRNPGFKQEDNHPVAAVTWNDAQEFCKWTTKATGRTVRLPTEAEWEYACRAGTSTTYYSGNSDEDLKRVAWYKSNSNDTTHPVGQKEPNKFGLYDMHGNVWQWCQDWYGDFPANEIADPQGPAKGDFHVLRGGSWDFGPGYCRAWFSPGTHHNDFGFRVVAVCGLSRTP